MIDFSDLTEDDLAERALSLGLPSDAFTPRRLAYLTERIDDSAGPDQCWLWTGPKQGSGYGVASAGGTTCGPHRLMFVLAHGPIPDRKLLVRHTCDNPPCCNPAHLRSGTYAQNRADTVSRGRARSRVLTPDEVEFIPRLTDRLIRNAASKKRRMTRPEAFAWIADVFDVSAGHAGLLYDRRRRAGTLDTVLDTEPAAPAPDAAP
jgi:hypothetical protein